METSPSPRSPRDFAAWGLVVLAGAAAVVTTGAGLFRILRHEYGLVPLTPNAWAALQGPAIACASIAALIVVFVLLPFQRWGNDPARHRRLSLFVTATAASMGGIAWLLRLNLVGFASLWERRSQLGGWEVPTALLETRVWSGNIMLLLATAIGAVILRGFVDRCLSSGGPRPAPLGLTATAALVLAAVGVVAALPADLPAPEVEGSRLFVRWMDDAALRSELPRLQDDPHGTWTLAERELDAGRMTLLSFDGRIGRRFEKGAFEGWSRRLSGREETRRIDWTRSVLAASERPVIAFVEVSDTTSIARLLSAREDFQFTVLVAPEDVIVSIPFTLRASEWEPVLARWRSDAEGGI